MPERWVRQYIFPELRAQTEAAFLAGGRVRDLVRGTRLLPLVLQQLVELEQFITA